MSIMRNMAIKYKLVSIIMLTCVAALLLAGGVFVFSEWAALRRDIVQAVSTHAAMTGDNCKAAVAFEDVNDAKNTLSTLREEPSIAFACIRDKKGNLFASYSRDPGLKQEKFCAIPASELGLDDYHFNENYLIVRKPIVLDKEVIGTICLRSELEPLYVALKSKIVTIIGVVVLALLAAYLISSRLQRIISGPILGLARVAKLVSEEQNYGARAMKESNDEIGKLIDSFNEMLEQIHSRDLALVKVNEGLEARVKERTTELLAANRELHNSVERANLMAKEAQEASESKSQFLANMSHEIRTPMNGILGFADVLIEEDMDEQHKKYVKIIRDCGRELLVLINDILDFSKIEANKLATEIASCSLADLLNSVESLMRPKALEKGLELRVVETPGLPAQIRTDPVRLRQCLVNLVGNAIKFTEKGHVHIIPSIYEEKQQAYIHFDIEDTGIGIPKDKLDTVFEVFTQADGSHTRKYGGSGLGLTITKRLSEILGGRLTVTSTEGKGSTFSLVLPVGVGNGAEGFLDRYNLADALKREPDKSAEAVFFGKVLVAEDSVTNQKLIELLLKRLGLKVTMVEDGLQALEAVRTHDFDMIFMDMQMPNMNGYEATKAMRSEGIATPVIALTANVMKGDDIKCFAAGCDEFIGKPLDRKKMLEVIGKYLPNAAKAVKEKFDTAT
ncbi:MAG: ATP-binding protein [Planctomycetota bacterium]